MPALQAMTILVAMASGKTFWQPKFWRKLSLGDQQIKTETWRIQSIVQAAASPVFLFSPLVVQKLDMNA